VAGSYLDETHRIVLLIDPARVDEAVRDLVRVGLDRVEAFADPAVLEGAAESQALAPHLVSSRQANFAELEALRAAGGSPSILDARGAAEHRARSIPGETNIAHTRLAARLADVPADEPLYVHCAVGARATVAASWLERQGRDVVVVDEAFSRWQPL
jgi:hydroxyacylglutathione hydrolase